MTLEEFVEKYKGKKVDFDGAYGAQCVDLARQYFKEVWGIPQPEGVEGAEDFFLKHDGRPAQKKHLRRVPYRGRGHAPPAGAAVVFSASAANKYGHIGICLESGAESITLFEQDGFKQDGAKITRRDCSRVLGWLVKRTGRRRGGGEG